MLENWTGDDKTKKVQRYIASPVLEDLKLWHRHFLPKLYNRA